MKGGTAFYDAWLGIRVAQARVKGYDHVKILHVRLPDKLVEIAGLSGLERMREGLFLVEIFNVPHLRKTGAAEVEVHEQGLAARLGVGYCERAARDGLALSRLRGHHEKHLVHLRIAWGIEEVAKPGYGFGELGILVLRNELGDLFAFLAPEMGQDSKHLESKTTFDIV